MPVSIVTPLVVPANKANRVLINLHGGGFTSDSGSLTESLPIANLTQIVIVVPSLEFGDQFVRCDVTRRKIGYS